MKESTRQILATVFDSDETVTKEQIENALGLLDGQELKTFKKETEPYVTLKEAAKRLGISTTTLWRLQVPGHSFGGHRRFRLSEIEDYLKGLETRQRAKQLRQQRRKDGGK